MGEESSFCISCGKIGNEWGDKNRATIMLTASAFSLLGMILSLVCLIGLSTDADIIMDTSWNYGETAPGIKFYVAPNAMIVEAAGETFKQEWNDASCNATTLSFLDEGSDTCNSCADAALGVVFTVIVSFLTSITTLQTDVQRSTRAGDLNCQKFM